MTDTAIERDISRYFYIKNKLFLTWRLCIFESKCSKVTTFLEMYDFKLTNHGAHALVNLSPEKQISAITKFAPFDIYKYFEALDWPIGIKKSLSREILFRSINFTNKMFSTPNGAYIHNLDVLIISQRLLKNQKLLNVFTMKRLDKYWAFQIDGFKNKTTFRFGASRLLSTHKKNYWIFSLISNTR